MSKKIQEPGDRGKGLAYTIGCVTCGATVGARCKTSKGYTTYKPHIDRQRGAELWRRTGGKL